jgi:hypothetical protein
MQAAAGTASIFEDFIIHAAISSQMTRYFLSYAIWIRFVIVAPPKLVSTEHRAKHMTVAQRLKESDSVDKNAVEASPATSDKVSALRSALRSAPPKKGARSRSPLKAAVAQLLPDLLAFRAKGYTSVELAEIMRRNGFVIAARTLNKYINEARARPANRRKKKIACVAAKSKTTAVKPSSRAADAARTMATPPSLLATKPPTQARKAAKDVLGHRFDDDV